jgi:hypothetical protein
MSPRIPALLHLGRSFLAAGVTRGRPAGRVVPSVMLLVLVTVGAIACARPERPVPSRPEPDSQLSLSVAEAAPRPGARGAPVDCAVDVANHSGRMLSRVILSCELLDERGLPLGSGLGTLQNVPDGQTRSVKTVVFGVRTYASARALVTSATFQ